MSLKARRLDLSKGRDMQAGSFRREQASWWLEGMLPHYVTAALWADGADAGVVERSGEFDASPYLHRFPRAELKVAAAEVLQFLKRPGVLDALRASEYRPDQAGHDLWLTRNGHGCGFWEADHCSEDAGELLTAAAKSIGPRGLCRVRGWFYWC